MKHSTCIWASWHHVWGKCFRSMWKDVWICSQNERFHAICCESGQAVCLTKLVLIVVLSLNNWKRYIVSLKQKSNPLTLLATCFSNLHVEIPMFTTSTCHRAFWEFWGLCQCVSPLSSRLYSWHWSISLPSLLSGMWLWDSQFGSFEGTKLVAGRSWSAIASFTAVNVMHVGVL